MQGEVPQPSRHWHLLGPLAFIGPTGIYWANGIYWAHWHLLGQWHLLGPLATAQTRAVDCMVPSLFVPQLCCWRKGSAPAWVIAVLQR